MELEKKLRTGSAWKGGERGRKGTSGDRREK
jgi:hypothetical protein